MTKWEGYEEVKAAGEWSPLPKDAYICKVVSVKEVQETSQNGNALHYLNLAFDIAEGPYKDYYRGIFENSQDDNKKWPTPGTHRIYYPKNDGSEQDKWTQSKFKTFTTSLEKSNNGYKFDWDENKMKGLLFGGLFRIEEYNGQNGVRQSTRLALIRSVETVRDKKYKELPEDKLLDVPSNKEAYQQAATAAAPIPNGFAAVEEDIPF